MPIMYKPFRIETNQEPEILTAFEEADIPVTETASGEPPADLVILERDGIHYINNRVLNPDKDTEKALNPNFLNLVKSLIKPAAPGAP
jgi:hypothetical protein